MLAERFSGYRNVMGARFVVMTPLANSRAIFERIIFGIGVKVNMIEFNAIGERRVAALSRL